MLAHLRKCPHSRDAMQIDLDKINRLLDADQRKLEDVKRAYQILIAYQKEKERVNSSELTALSLNQSLKSEPPPFRQSKSDVVRDIIKDFHNAFEVNDAFAVVQNKGINLEKNDVSFVLSRLAKIGEISIVQKGFGSTPSLYSNDPPSQSDDEDLSEEAAQDR